jgi:iron-sulfur cluster assembly accessory protein
MVRRPFRTVLMGNGAFMCSGFNSYTRSTSFPCRIISFCGISTLSSSSCVVTPARPEQFQDLWLFVQRQQPKRRMIVTVITTNSSNPSNSLQNPEEEEEEATNSSTMLDHWNSSIPNLYITESCMQRIRALASKRSPNHPESIYLRVFVDAGGCSGFQYKFELEDESLIEDENDIIIVTNYSKEEGSKVRVVVDKESLKLIQGSTIDYVDTMMKSSFEVRDNPQSEKACGCGSSFAIKKFQVNPATH